MFLNTFNFFGFLLGLTSWLVGAEMATYIRRPILFTGPLQDNLTTIRVPLTGMKVLEKCTEVNCMNIVTRPVNWTKFDQINEWTNMTFLQKFMITEMTGCMLFPRHLKEGTKSKWVGRGIESLGKDGWNEGELLLVDIIFVEPNGLFDPTHYAPPLESLLHKFDMRYENDEFRQEIANQVPPVCSATPTTRSASAEKEPASTRDDLKEAYTTEDTHSPDHTTDTQEPSTTTIEATETTTKAADSLKAVLTSYIWKDRMVYKFNVSCPATQQLIKVREVVFAKELTPELIVCGAFAIFYNGDENTISSTTNDKAEAYCTPKPCGRMDIPIGKIPFVLPATNKSYTVYGETDPSNAVCYAYATNLLY